MAELALLRIGGEAAEGIFHEGRQGRAGQSQAAGIAPVLQPAHYPEPLRVALEMMEVGLLRWRQRRDQRGARAGAEPVLDGRLAEMAKRDRNSTRLNSSP